MIINTLKLTLSSLLLATTLMLTSCGGGGGGSSSNPTNLPSAFTFSITSSGVKNFTLNWPASSTATYYKILENPDGASGYTEIATNITSTSYTHVLSAPLYERLNASYIVSSCNTNGCTDSQAVNVTNTILTNAIGYFKASNTGADDNFGYSVSLSADGTTLAVGAYLEASNATGVGGNQNDNAASNAGAVYVFTNTNNSWSQTAYLKASNTEANDYFGTSLGLSSDGTTLAVGALFEDSNATGVDGNQSDNAASAAGAVYVFTNTNNSWSQTAYLKASNTEANDLFGWSLSLSSDGTTLAVGAYLEDSNATGVGGNQSDNAASAAGAVYVFTNTNNSWSQTAYLKASNTGAGDRFGYSLGLSSDGTTLAVGALLEDSSATGVGGNQSDNAASDAGAVYVFTNTNNSWSQTAYLKASNTEANDYFGTSLGLSSDGTTLAVGAYLEDSNATGVVGNQSDNAASDAGAVYVFTNTNNNWSQTAYLKANNTEANDNFGTSLSLSSDGTTLAVGALFEDSNATGVGGNQSDNAASDAGAVYVFTNTNNNWSQTAYLKASNTEADDNFGTSLGLSSDGTTLAVGARLEDSSAAGVGGNQIDNTASNAGAVYVY